MQIEAGKYYRTRDGRKVGPAEGPTEHGNYKVGGYYLYPGGEVAGLEGHPDSAVAEWSDGPVRTETVTKRRIVPGVYGRLEVLGTSDEGIVRVRFAPRSGGTDTDGHVRLLTATELDDLAMVASQLAEALREESGIEVAEYLDAQ